MSILKTKPYKSVEVGEWLFEWFYNEKNIRGCYLKISTKSAMFELNIGGSSHTYGYLLAAAEQGKLEQLHGFIAMLYVASNVLTKDQGFANGITKEINKWMKRQERKATSEAKAVKDHEEAASAAFMEDIVSEQGMSKKELKAKREADKAEMRAILNEDKE